MIISEMQRKLATWAAIDPCRRIERLLRLITQPEWLAEAARITISSKGAHTPGIDGVSKATLQTRQPAELQRLRDELLSGHYQPLPARRVYIPKSKIDMVEIINRKLKGWAAFYQFVDFKAKVFSYIDRVVFWKLAHWLARKYRIGIASLMRWWCKSPKPGQSKTWVLFGKTNHDKLNGEVLYWLVG
ncbi:group II intron, maturase-specific domain protein [Providencia alcalifaciens R90-1475]|nr:group II intron, maturase-specific domain protein [Providencia alcalifaciens R90-1475]